MGKTLGTNFKKKEEEEKEEGGGMFSWKDKSQAC